MTLDYINIDSIPFGIYRNGPVGISVSCGADSAIMLYILMNEISDDLHIYNVIGDYRKHVLEPAFDNVVNKCAELTNKKNFTVHKIHTSEKPLKVMYNTFKERLDSNEVDIVYTGITKFPPDEVYDDWMKLPKWHVETRRAGRTYPTFGGTISVYPTERPDGSFDTKEDSYIIDIDERVYTPLFNYDKRDIARIYRALNMEENLFPVTRSCENDTHIDGHCGECWWCKERLWGFGHL